MIHVSQGHESGIGLEVFLKSILCLNQLQINFFRLYCFKHSLEKTLNTLNIKYRFSEDYLVLNRLKVSCLFLKKSIASETTDSLNSAIAKIKNAEDFLLTLPSSKDQIFFNGKQVSGYTEYFRKKYKNKSISMNFISDNKKILLLTEHISIQEVVDNLSESLIIDKVRNSIDNLLKIIKLESIIFTGIDPHCGENGLISDHDKVFENVIKSLANSYKHLSISGPYPADTIHLLEKKKQLVVYAYHDQALAKFKSENGVLGINFTSGLPFTRVSVDHGTAFDIFGKNIANYLGMLFVLQNLILWQKKTLSKR